MSILARQPGASGHEHGHPSLDIEAPSLAEDERQRVLYEWNATHYEYPRHMCMHELFAAQAARTPDAVAVVFDATKDEGRRTNDGHTDTAFSVQPPRGYPAFSVQSLTYRELDRRANQLAWYLRNRGVGPEVLVGICLDRSPTMIVGLLGVLKAGGAYVPLDPAYPAERIAYMLADSQAAVVITKGGEAGGWRLEAGSQSPVSSLQSPVSRAVVDLRADWPIIAQEADTPLDSGVRPANLAYVIYTSGSTGTPKGVAIMHRSAVAFIAWALTVFAPEELRGVLAGTSICFDLSVFELFATLSSGGTIILAENALELPEHPAAQSVTLINSVPSAVAELLRMEGIPSSTRTINLAGEPLPLKLVQQLYQQATIRRVVNLYGPSEDTTYSTYAVIPRGDVRPPTIGRPIANTQVYLLDTRMQPVAIGEVGELCLGGDGLARGYLNRADSTAERFVPNPFATTDDRRLTTDQRPTTNDQTDHLVTLSPCHLVTSPGERLYRTGDLARYRPDGQIEFLGRRDHQVKIRGFRIELGEIEATLSQHPAMHECVVVARADESGERQLVAYVVPDQGSGVGGQGSGATTNQRPTTNDQRSQDRETRRQGDKQGSDHLVTLSPCHLVTPHSSLVTRHSSLVSELRTFLATRLPSSMLPTAFVLLDALPRTPNGKIDRQALPAPSRPRSVLDHAYAPPRTDLEAALATIWAEVLEVEAIGIHDHFIALGGHSLHATRIAARVQEVLRIDMNVRNLFERPTVAEQAAAIAANRQTAAYAAQPLVPVGRDKPLLPSFGQQRLWFLDQWDPGNPVYNVPIAIRMAGPLDIATLQRSLNRIVERHETLRTTFAEIDGRPVPVIAAQSMIALPSVDLSAQPAPERDSMALQFAREEARHRFDLARGPLVRATLLRLDDEEHILILVMHHVVSDDWSMGVLFHELGALYAAYRADRPASLPALPIQYADFAIWQRQWLQGAIHEKQLAYWLRQLADAPAALELPADRPRPPAQSFRGAIHTFPLPAHLVEMLADLSRRDDATLFMTLLAAFNTLLHRYTGQTDILVGSPIAGRTRSEVEPLIGFFINTLVLRVDLAGNPTFQALLGCVREVCLSAYAHQELPFEQLVETLQPTRDLSRPLLIQVMLVLENAPAQPLYLDQLMLTPIMIDNGTAKFDLALYLEKTAHGLRGRLEYSTDLFDDATIRRMARHFQTLLEGIVAEPELPIASLSLLRAAERQLLLHDWNDTLRGVRGQGSGVSPTVHQLFAAQAARHPDMIALVFEETTNDQRPTTDYIQDKETRRQGDKEIQGLNGSVFSVQPPRGYPAFSVQHLTYRELDERANRLGQALRSLGVGADVPVAVYLERSLDLVVALLAILKAGGAYVPIAPATPADRLATILQDTQAPVLITTTDQRPPTTDHRPPTNEESAPSSFVLRPSSLVVDLRRDWPTIAEQPATSPDSGTTSANLAYLIYTSGSTGTPKGVPISHTSLLNLVAWHQRVYHVTLDDRATLLAGVAFDASVWELWPYLLAGASIHIPDAAILVDVPVLIDWLAAHGITICFMPTPLAEVAIDAPWPRHTALRRLLIGGDRLHRPPRPGLPFTLINNYGPTENTVVTTWTTLAPVQDADGTPPPIGRPIDNVQVYLLDTRMQPVPTGVPGELYIGGIGLAQGYWRRPSMTAERFVPNPFARGQGSGVRDQESEVRSQKANDQRPTTNDQTDQLVPLSPCHLVTPPGERLYRTGDLARYRADGQIEYLGRIDHQVKIRGFRIELGEIEVVLGQHPNVREAVVLARADRSPTGVSTDMELVAYVVPNREQGTGNREQENPELGTDSLSPVTCHLSPVQLRAFLKTKLPEYMIPGTFVLLDALPRTPNGKVDRRALPAPEALPASDQAYIAPRTPIEAILATMWHDALQLTRVSIDDNFFDLGGHSLNATRIVSRIRQAFQINMLVRQLFETPTVATLADYMVATEPQPGRTDKIARALQRVQQMSAADRQQILQQKKRE